MFLTKIKCYLREKYFKNQRFLNVIIKLIDWFSFYVVVRACDYKKYYSDN